MAELENGQQLIKFAGELFPICRSITGNGVRKTLRLIQRHIPLKIHEVRSHSRVFDWEVPLEWNVEDAFIKSADGQRLVDFQAHNLHLVSYSEPVSLTLSLEELKTRLHVHATNPAWIPYRTSYYRRNWGFCLSQQALSTLSAGRYEVRIDSSLANGSLSYGEYIVQGRTRDEVVFFTHVCHPSLANDNVSGMVLATKLAIWIAQAPRRFTYRFIFAPGTIGSLCWLKKNERRLGRIRHGLVLGLLADSGKLTYKRSRRGDAEIDTVAKYVVESEFGGTTIPFEPYGYDERQLCSPGFNLPVGRLTRSVNDGYPEYHSSADNLEFIKLSSLEGSFDALKNIVEVLEDNRRFINLSPKGEPRLGKRGLYGAVGGQSPAAREHAMLWVLNQSDGGSSLLDIAQRSGLAFSAIRAAAAALEDAKLLKKKGGTTAGSPASGHGTGRAAGSAASKRLKSKSKVPARSRNRK